MSRMHAHTLTLAVARVRIAAVFTSMIPKPRAVRTLDTKGQTSLLYYYVGQGVAALLSAY